jgi:hypothetical protein
MHCFPYNCLLVCTLENGTFNIGDTWVGTYTCTKQYINGTKALDGEQDIKRLTMLIKQVSQNNVISANIDFDWTTGALNGTGQYLAAGTYDPTGVCQAVSMNPTNPAWLTGHPLLVPARSLVGRLSDDRQTYYGDISLNLACQCAGISPYNRNTGPGSSCYLNTTTGFSWCYTNSTCPDASPDPANPGYYITPCNQYVACTGFSLARICSNYRPSCPSGWVGYQYRYDAFSLFFFLHYSFILCLLS